jgi:hypothetical protein
MPTHTHSMILNAYCEIHAHVLTFGETLTDSQLNWQATPGSLTIAFFLWHLGRWADHLQAAVPGMTPELSQRMPPGRQVWETQGFARAWGFDSSSMGYAETGMHMDEAAAARLRFPSKEILLDYVRQAFAAAELAIQSIDEEQFSTKEQPQPVTEGIWEEGETVGRAIFAHLLHDHAHFGMMQILLGQQMESE